MPTDWIAATGLRAVDSDATSTLVPTGLMDQLDLSLIARGLYALLLVEQGAPVDPFENALDDETEIAAAIEELVAAGLAVRVPAPRD
jgi:hypothetical protein